MRVRLRESKAIISTFSSLSLSLNTKAGSVVIATSLVIILTTLGQFYQHFYTQLLNVQIQKVQKDSQVISVFLCIRDMPL